MRRTTAILALGGMLAACGGGEGAEPAPTTESLTVAAAVPTTAVDGLGADLPVISRNGPLDAGKQYRIDGPHVGGQITVVTGPPNGAHASVLPGSIAIGTSASRADTFLSIWDLATLQGNPNLPFVCPDDAIISLDNPADERILEDLTANPFVRDAVRSEVEIGDLRAQKVEYSIAPFPATAPMCDGDTARSAVPFGSAVGQVVVAAHVTDEPGARWVGILVDLGLSTVFIHGRVSEATEQVLSSLALADVPRPAGAEQAEVLHEYDSLEAGRSYLASRVIADRIGVVFTAPRSLDGPFDTFLLPGYLHSGFGDVYDVQDLLGISDPFIEIEQSFGIAPDSFADVSEPLDGDVLRWLEARPDLRVLRSPSARTVDGHPARWMDVTLADGTGDADCDEPRCGFFVFSLRRGMPLSVMEGRTVRVTQVDLEGQSVLIAGDSGDEHEAFLSALRFVEG